MTKSNGLMRKTMWGGAAAFALGLAAFLPQHSAVAEDMKVVPPPKVDVPAGAAKTETAVLAGGCFWGVQGVFQHVKGVKDAVAGYTGGAAATALYPVVSTGTTGHAESVRITYDPQEVSYGKLLQIYFSVVTDPTTLNAQGRDEGTQYRSNIFPANAEQEKVAKAYVAQLQQAHVFGAPVVTKVTPLKAFYQAEGYHQNYLSLHPTDGYIAENDIPKVEGLKKLFPQDWKPGAVLTATN